MTLSNLLFDQQIQIQTINIPSSCLNGNSEKRRMDHIQELINGLGVENFHSFLNATTRGDVLKSEYKNAARFTDAYYGKDLKPELQKIGDVQQAAEKVWDWVFQDQDRIDQLHSGSKPLIICKDVLGCSEAVFKEIDQEKLNRGLNDSLRNKTGRTACTLSHLRALEKAREQYQKGEIKAKLITEDDIQIKDNKKFTEVFQKAMNDLQNRDWDILMLGASGHIPKSKNMQYNAEEVAGSDNLVKVKFAYGNFAYLVNGSSIDKIIKLIEDHLKNRKPVYAQDVIYAEAMESGELNVFSTQPKTVTCVPCYSLLCEKKMDYSKVLESEWQIEKG